MPKRELFGAQPPVELLRQFVDQGGWYDKKELNFMKYEDVTTICSMTTTNRVTDRLYIHFNLIGFEEMSEDSIIKVFKTLYSVIIILSKIKILIIMIMIILFRFQIIREKKIFLFQKQ